MSAIQITNGFPNHSGPGILLTGILIEGRIDIGDKLIISTNEEVEIMEIEFIKSDSKDHPQIAITLSRDEPIKWFQLYNKTIEIRNTSHNKT